MATEDQQQYTTNPSVDELFNLIYSGGLPVDESGLFDFSQFFEPGGGGFDEQAWLEGTGITQEQWDTQFGDVWLDEDAGVYNIEALLTDPSKDAAEKLAVLQEIMTEQWAPDVTMEGVEWGNLQSISSEELSQIMSNDALRYRWLAETMEANANEGGKFNLGAESGLSVGGEAHGSVSDVLEALGDITTWDDQYQAGGNTGGWENAEDWQLKGWVENLMGLAKEEQDRYYELHDITYKATDWQNYHQGNQNIRVEGVSQGGNKMWTHYQWFDDHYYMTGTSGADAEGNYTGDSSWHLKDETAMLDDVDISLDTDLSFDSNIMRYLEAIQEGWVRTENYLDTSNLEGNLQDFQAEILGLEGELGFLGDIGIMLGQIGMNEADIQGYLDKIEQVKADAGPEGADQATIDGILAEITYALGEAGADGSYQIKIDNLQSMIDWEVSEAEEGGTYSDNKARYQALVEESYASGQAGGYLQSQLSDIQNEILIREAQGLPTGDLKSQWDVLQGQISSMYQESGYSWDSATGIATKLTEGDIFEGSYAGQIATLESQIAAEKAKAQPGGEYYEEMANIDNLIEKERARGLEGGEYKNEIARLEALIKTGELSASEEGQAQQEINNLNDKIGVEASEGIEATGTYAEIERLENLKALSQAEMGTAATEAVYDEAGNLVSEGQAATGKYADIVRAEQQIANLQGQIGFYEEQRTGYGEDITRKEEQIAWQEQQRNILQRQSFANVRDLMSPYTAQAKAHRFSGGGDPTAQYLSQVYGDMGAYGAGLQGIQGTISQQEEDIRNLEDWIGEITTTTIPGIMGEQDTQAGLREGYYGDIETILTDILPGLGLDIEAEEFLRSGYETDIVGWQDKIDDLINITIPGLQDDLSVQEGLIEGLGLEGAGPDGILEDDPLTEDVDESADNIAGGEVTDINLREYLLSKGVAQTKIDEILAESGGDVQTWRSSIAEKQLYIDQVSTRTAQWEDDALNLEQTMLEITGSSGAENFMGDDPLTTDVDESLDDIAITDPALLGLLTEESFFENEILLLGDPGSDNIWGEGPTEDVYVDGVLTERGERAPTGTTESAQYLEFIRNKKMIDLIGTYTGAGGVYDPEATGGNEAILALIAEQGITQTDLDYLMDVTIPGLGVYGTDDPDTAIREDWLTAGGSLQQAYQTQLDKWNPYEWNPDTGAYGTWSATGDIATYQDLISGLQGQIDIEYGTGLSQGYQTIQDYLYGAATEPTDFFNTWETMFEDVMYDEAYGGSWWGE